MRSARIRVLSPLVNRDFALLWTGRTVSTLGDWVFLTAVTLWIATDIADGQRWAPLAVGGLDITAAIVTVAFGPLAGVFVDRWSKRRTMLAADAIRCALMCTLIPLPLLGAAVPVSVRLGALFAVVGATAVCTALFIPAQLAMIGDIVEKDEQARAASAQQVGFSAALIVGPALGAPLFFAVGVQWALAINAVSYLASFAAVRAIAHRGQAIRRQRPGPAGVGRDLLNGLRWVAGRPVLRALFATTFVVTCGTGATSALAVFFVQDDLHAPAAWYGAFTTCLAVGAIAGALVMGAIAARIGEVRLYAGSLLGAGLVIVAMSRLTSFPPAAVAMFLVGVANAGLNVATMPILLNSTPHDMIGRVGAIMNPLTSVARLGSVALATYLASTALHDLDARFGGMRLGTYDAIFGACGLVIAAAAMYALLTLPVAAEASSERAPEAAAG